jgi:hypothetical protein
MLQLAESIWLSAIAMVFIAQGEGWSVDRRVTLGVGHRVAYLDVFSGIFQTRGVEVTRERLGHSMHASSGLESESRMAKSGPSEDDTCSPD